MIIEIARITVKPGAEEAFEAGVKEALPLFQAAQGCRNVKLHRGVERPQDYLLVIGWETLEDHVTTFRQSPAFARWRELIGPHLAGTPDVQHVRTAVAFPD